MPGPLIFIYGINISCGRTLRLSTRSPSWLDHSSGRHLVPHDPGGMGDLAGRPTHSRSGAHPIPVTCLDSVWAYSLPCLPAACATQCNLHSRPRWDQITMGATRRRYPHGHHTLGTALQRIFAPPAAAILPLAW